MLFHMHDHQFSNAYTHTHTFPKGMNSFYLICTPYFKLYMTHSDPMHIWRCVNYVHLLWTRKRIFQDLDSFWMDKHNHIPNWRPATERVCLCAAAVAFFLCETMFWPRSLIQISSSEYLKDAFPICYYINPGSFFFDIEYFWLNNAFIFKISFFFSLLNRFQLISFTSL